MDSVWTKAISSAHSREVLNSASQKETAPIDTGKRESFQCCRDCRAEALIPDLLQIIIKTCKATLKSHPYIDRNAASASPMSESRPSSMAVQSELQVPLDLEQVDEQQKSEPDNDETTKLGAVARDEERPEREEAKSKKHSYRLSKNSETRCITCRLRRVRCDEDKPACQRCLRGGFQCEYKREVYNFPQKNDTNTTAGVAAGVSSEQGSANASSKKDSSPGYEHLLPARTANKTTPGPSGQPPPSDRLPETVEKTQSAPSTIEHLQHSNLHVSVNSAIADSVKSDLSTGNDASGEDITSDNSRNAPSSISRRFSSTVYNIGFSRRLFDVVTSLLLLEDVIRPETVSVIATYDPDLYEVVVHLLLGCASQLCKLHCSFAYGHLRMMKFVALIEDTARFAREKPSSSRQRKELSQNEYLTNIERSVNLLMDLTTTIEDVVDDLSSHEVVPQQHASKSCMRHISTEAKTVTIQDPSLSTLSGSQTHYPSMESSWVLLNDGPDKGEADSLRVPPASVDPALPQIHHFDTTGQKGPPGVKPKVTVTLWEDQRTSCLQIEAMGVVISRRQDNNFVNGSNLLDVADRIRGPRARIIESEKVHYVMSTGPAQMRGFWIPYDRALHFANSEMITNLLHPLFVHDIGGCHKNPDSASQKTVAKIGGTRQINLNASRIPSILRPGIGSTNTVSSAVNQGRSEYTYGGSDSIVKEVSADDDSSVWSTTRVGKRRKPIRFARACNLCRERLTKCEPGDGLRCWQCLRLNEACIYR